MNIKVSISYVKLFLVSILVVYKDKMGTIGFNHWNYILYMS